MILFLLPAVEQVHLIATYNNNNFEHTHGECINV